MMAIGRSGMTSSEPTRVARLRLPSTALPCPEDERQAFDRLVREHERALQAFALRLTGRSSDASDLVQDCLERALRRQASFAPGTNARAWFFKILHNAFIDRCRARSAAGRTASLDDVDLRAPEPCEPPAWTSVTEVQLGAAIAKLEDEFQVVYRMHAIDSLSYKEISLRLGIPVNTVGTRISRARGKLRTLLEASIRDGGST